ncbi:MAG: NAD/NADP octopine/nopaline dehydrogenase family protein [Muribaculaceae bacterium]|nr:NAD/NADP octopine/nopaline dehydrogenase family protein [Muribaculaceae bacterium]MDE6753215.1 NAD/NADP octopine/nopaline dehydrogenase family protein [Muribaculaceae bacterium]
MKDNTPTLCICGGGSLGLVCAGVFLSEGLIVNILTGHPEKWSKEIVVYDSDKKSYSGVLNHISDKAGEVVPEADIILLCLPGYLIEKTLREIKPYLKKDTSVGSIVASTGFFFSAHDILPKDIQLFGFQRVPFIARQREYGRIGDLLGYKPSLNVVIENSRDIEKTRLILEQIFQTPVKTLDNYLEVSLTNSNPILHTGRLYTMWSKDDFKKDRQSFFYKDWTDEASECLIKMDNEFQALLRKLNIGSEVIPPLLDYYESTDSHSLTLKIKSIPAFREILSPMIKVDEEWHPDFNSRYFTEDFPYGLRFIRDLAHKHSVPCPTIDKVFEWGMSKLKE